MHHLLHGLLVTGRESMSKRGIGRYTQQGVNLVPLVRGLTVLKLDEQGSEVSVLVPPRLPCPPSRQDIENRSGLVLGEHRQEGSKVEKGPRRNVLTAVHEHDGPGAGDLFDDPDPRKPGATEECTESAGKAFADVIVMFHSCRRIPAKWLAHEPQHLPRGGFPSHQRIHLKGVAFQDAHDSHQHIRVLGPLAEPDDTSFGILVYPLHLRNLVALFLLVALVNADGIDPEDAIGIGAAQVPECGRQVVGDGLVAAIQDDGRRRFVAALAVGHGFVLRVAGAAAEACFEDSAFDRVGSLALEEAEETNPITREVERRVSECGEALDREELWQCARPEPGHVAMPAATLLHLSSLGASRGRGGLSSVIPCRGARHGLATTRCGGVAHHGRADATRRQSVLTDSGIVVGCWESSGVGGNIWWVSIR